MQDTESLDWEKEVSRFEGMMNYFFGNMYRNYFWKLG
jgi:hypothetical protein